MYEVLKALDFWKDKELVRSMWTTYCVFFRIECDTYEYDTTLREIYDSYCNSSKFKTFKNFDEFMCKYLV